MYICNMNVYYCLSVLVGYFIFTADIIWRYGGHTSCELAKDTMCVMIMKTIKTINQIYNTRTDTYVHAYVN